MHILRLSVYKQFDLGTKYCFLHDLLLNLVICYFGGSPRRLYHSDNAVLLIRDDWLSVKHFATSFFGDASEKI